MKKLLVVVGAGSSQDFDMPSVRDVDRLFESWSKKEMPLKDNSMGLYTYIKSKIEEYAKQNANNYLSAIVNFENIIYAIQNLSALVIDKDNKRYNHRLNPFIDIKTLPEIIDYLKRITPPSGHDLSHLHSYLTDRLLNYMRERAAMLKINHNIKLGKINDFFSALRTQFEVGFINLNYDNVILSAIDGLQTGFNTITGEFDRELVFASKWNFCYHLHGSVYFDMIGKDVDMHRIFWNSDLNSTFHQNSSGRSSFSTTEGIDHLHSNIIMGLDKSNQLLRDPFITYYSQIDRLIFESDAVLFIGYGFSDYHLNNHFTFIRDDKKIRKVVVIDWADKYTDGLRYRHDHWTYGLFHAVPYNSYEMGGGMSREPRPAVYYKKNKMFEKSSNPQYPLAVWYNGFVGACNYPDKFIAELL